MGHCMLPKLFRRMGDTWRSHYHHASDSPVGRAVAPRDGRRPPRRHGRARVRYRMFGERTGLRVSELALGAGTFGTRWGYGAEPEEARRIFDRFAEAGGNFVDCADAYQFGAGRDPARPVRRRRPRPLRPRHQVHAGGRARGRRLAHRQRPQEHGPLGRGEPEAARDRPHRPLLGPHGRRHDPDRGDRARLRGPGAGRQGPPRRPLRLPGLADRPGGDAGRAARLGPDRRHPGRVQPGRAHVRPRAAADGRGARPRGDGLVALGRRPALRQVPPRRDRPADGLGHPDPHRARPARGGDPGRGRGRRRRDRGDAGPGRRRLGEGQGPVPDPGPPHAGPARGQSRRARCRR